MSKQDYTVRSGDCNPQPFPISEKTAKRVQRDIEFICKQLVRFAKMPMDEHMAYLRRHPNQAFHRIPRPDGKGHLQCGHLAWKRLDALVDVALDLDHNLDRRVARQRAMDAITDAFVRQVLSKAHEVNLETSTLLLQDTLAELSRSLAVTEHYLPCVLFPDGAPDEFNVGPVTFARKRKFFQEKRGALKLSVDVETAAHIEHVNAAVSKGLPRDRSIDAIESRRLVRALQANAVKAYRGYPWIASISVINCDKETSQERATQTVEMALHVLRILLGAEPTKKIRLAWSRGDALRTAHLFSDSKGVINPSFGISVLGPVGTKNWHEALMRSSSELAILGSALKSIANPIKIPHLQHRLLDAINWYGDAATDANSQSSIVKYVSAIERLFFGAFEKNHTKNFGGRIKDIFDAFGCNDDKRAYEQALDVYKARSALVHGARSTIDMERHKIVYQAASLSRMCILCAAQLYPMMLQVFGDPDPAQLEDVMKRINREGLNWLAELAGYTASVRH